MRFTMTLCLLGAAALPLFAQPALTAEHVANAGVMLGCGEDRVLVDALFREGVAGYEVIPGAKREAMETAQALFRNVRLIVVTHRHRDHFDAQSVARHLASNPGAKFVGTPEAVAAVAAIHPERLRAARAPESFAESGVSLRFYPIPHNPVSTGAVEHHSVQIDWCGKSVLFTGDADFNLSVFRRAGIQPGGTDILFAPFWITMSEQGRRIVRELIQPGRLWALHGDTRDAARWVSSVRDFDPQAAIGKHP